MHQNSTSIFYLTTLVNDCFFSYIYIYIYIYISVPSQWISCIIPISRLDQVWIWANYVKHWLNRGCVHLVRHIHGSKYKVLVCE
jgi:hypothetical protein